MVVALQDFLEPDPFRAGPHANSRRGPHTCGQVGGQQARSGEEIPTAAGRIEPQGEHRRRGQIAARVRGRDQMQAQGPPAGHRVIPHQLESALHRTRNEAQPRAPGIDHRPRGDLHHEHHVQRPLPRGPQRPAPVGARGQVEEGHAVALAEGERQAIPGPREFLPLPARLRRPREAWEFHAGTRARGNAGAERRYDQWKQFWHFHGWRVVSSGSPGAARLRAGSNSRFRSPATGLKCTVSPSSPRGSNWRPAMSFA